MKLTPTPAVLCPQCDCAAVLVTQASLANRTPRKIWQCTDADYCGWEHPADPVPLQAVHLPDDASAVVVRGFDGDKPAARIQVELVHAGEVDEGAPRWAPESLASGLYRVACRLLEEHGAGGDT